MSDRCFWLGFVLAALCFVFGYITGRVVSKEGP